MDDWDKRSKLLEADEEAVQRLHKGLTETGYLDSAHPELLKRLSVPAVLFAGEKSECIGRKNIEIAAKKWEIPLTWFSKSGHFIYIEEPQLFSSRAIAFLRGTK